MRYAKGSCASWAAKRLFAATRASFARLLRRDRMTRLRNGKPRDSERQRRRDGSTCRRLMHGAPAGRLVVAPADFHHTALAVHGLGPHPVGERVVGPVLASPLRRGVEIPVDAEKLFPAAPKRGIGVKDPAGVVLDKDAVA